MRCPKSRFPIRIIVFDELELIIFVKSQGLTLSTASLVLIFCRIVNIWQGQIWWWSQGLYCTVFSRDGGFHSHYPFPISQSQSLNIILPCFRREIDSTILTRSEYFLSAKDDLISSISDQPSRRPGVRYVVLKVCTLSPEQTKNIMVGSSQPKTLMSILLRMLKELEK